MGLCVGRFYNNTVAYNTATFYNGNSESKTVGGVRMAVNAGNELLMANTIIFGNSGLAVDITSGTNPAAPFIHCYVQSEAQMTKANFMHALGNHVVNNDGNFGVNNVFLNHQAPSAANTPFEADIKNGAYSGGAKTGNNFQLRQTGSVNCVNHGTEEFEEAMEESLSTPGGSALSNDLKTQFRNAVRGVSIPKKDVVFANRVQDCQIDIGAYEYDGASSIKPDTTTHPGIAIFYVAFDGVGNASGDSKSNAACNTKLQQIIDAAGRYKHVLMTANYYNKGAVGSYEANKPNKGRKTWFGYCKDDGFEKRKHLGRIDARNKYSKIKENWLNAYHQMVYERLAPHLDEADKAWLREATSPIS